MRLLIPFVLVAALVAGSKLLIEDVLGLDLAPLLEAWARDAGTREAILIAALLVADIVLPVPSSLVMIVSGAAFGVAWGSAIALAGSIAGEWLGFEVARAWGARVTARLVGPRDAERLGRIFARHGAAAVALSRALPVLMETMSVMAGASRMRRRTFLAASLAGTVPVAIAYAYAGAVSRQTGTVLPAVIMVLAVAGLAWVVYRVRVSAD